MTTPAKADGRDIERYCGARKRQGDGTCRRPAGWGTDHVGAGRCKLHGGSTPTHQRGAAKDLIEQRARAEIRKLGMVVVVDSQQALLDLVHEAAANVAFYRMLVQQLEPAVGAGAGEIEGPGDEPPYIDDIDRSELGTSIAGRVDPANWKAAPHVLVTMYDAERDRLADYASRAIKAGLAEREVQLAERQGELVVRLITGVLDHAELALTFAQRELGRRLAGRLLRELSAGVIDVESEEG